MAINPMLRSSPTRIMGLASGMDTDSIIQATLRMHQFKIDNQMRNKKLIEWKQNYHNEIKDQIKTFQSTYLQTMASKSMLNRNAFNTNLATAMSGGKASTAVTVTASSSSSLGSLTILSVNSLAKGASFTSSSSVSNDGKGFNPSSTLGSLRFGGNSAINFGDENDYMAKVTDVNGNATTITKADLEGGWEDYQTIKLQGGPQVEFTKDGDNVTYRYKIDDTEHSGTVSLAGDGTSVSFTVDGKEVTLSNDEGDIKVAVDDSEPAALGFYQRKFATGENGEDVLLTRSVEGGAVWNGSKQMNEAAFYGEATLTINNTPVTLTSNMTISEMVAKVNKEVSGVTMSYDRMNDVFKLEGDKVGADASSLIVEDVVGGDIVSKLFGTTTTAQNGTQASITLSNGATVTSDTNTIEYRGLSIKVNHTTTEFLEDGVTANPNYSTDPITVSVTRDTDKAVNAIKDFLESYNSLIRKLEGLLNERKKTNEVGYKPLTDEEKSAMTEKQVEEWEAIAKKGILRSDRGLQDLVSDLRGTFFKEIEGMGLSASQLGLTTGNYFGGTGGQIILDEEGEKKLRAALEEDPDKVADLFTKIGADANGKSEGQGLMYKINDVLNNYVGIGKTQSVTIEALEKSLKEANERLEKMEERMYAEEDRLYRQFAAMEAAMSKMQQQGDWFSAMLGG